MPVSVIISNYNGAKYLPRLLESLDAQRGVQTQVIVVDRFSEDESQAILAKHPHVLTVPERPETGLVSGYAAGAKHAVHDNLFFCNEDLWLDESCLLELERSVDIEAAIWAADPWQWSYDGIHWHHGGTRFQRSPRLVPDSVHPFRIHRFCEPLRRGEVVPLGCAGAIIMNRRVYERLGGWDTGFFLDREDTDIFLRAWREKWKCVSVPEAKVFHAVGASNAQRIQGGRIAVSKKRYMSGRSSQLIIGVKYFPGAWVACQFFIYLAWSLFHLISLRLKQFAWDMLALREFTTRLPNALRYRRATARLRRTSPGQNFFTEKDFQAGDGVSEFSPAQPIALGS